MSQFEILTFMLRPRLAILTAQRDRKQGLSRRRGTGQCLPQSNPTDHDGGADHVGGALLAFGTSGHSHPLLELYNSLLGQCRHQKKH
jgi:hypothetical protein